MTQPDLDPAACRGRQQRLLAQMQEQRLDLVVLTQNVHVYWLTGAWIPWTFAPAVALRSDGHLTLAGTTKTPQEAAADTIVRYEAQWHSTMRNDQRQASSQALLAALRQAPAPRRLGVEFSSFAPHLARELDAELVDVEPVLYQLRRKKDADELALLRKAIDGTQQMYQRAREIIAPGVSELEVFNQLQAAAVETFGEMLTGTGNDYQCGERGGPPRGGRRAQAGELYILDLGPAYRGYFADNARTIAVSEPTDQQLEAWRHVAGVFELVERQVRPGVSARDLFHQVQQLLDQAPLGEFNHHLGHGIGLFPHEAPHLNPHWDDTFQPGDVFTVEPGLYAPELRAGLRLENDYLVTDDGVQLLTPFPLEY